jgi:sugar lactone lactonase YvrE
VQPLWFTRDPEPKTSSAFAAASSPDGSTVYVTGYRNPNFTDDNFETVAYESTTGAELWSASYEGPAAGYDVALAAVVSPDGATLYVAGSSEGEPFDTDWATIAYDTSDGSQRWLTRYTGGPPGSGNSPSAVGISPDGATLYVTGETTIAYVAATGAQLWQREIAAFGGYAVALAVSPDGSRVYVGARVGPFDLDYLTVAYDGDTGTKAWASQYEGPGGGDDVPTALAVAPTGGAVYTTGQSVGIGTGDDYATVAYDTSDGSQQWAARFTGPGDHSDVPADVDVGPDGSAVFVTGHVSTGFARKYLTLALDPVTGQQRWMAVGKEGGVLPSALSVGPDGSRVYVTGGSFDTVAYDAQTGARVWVFGSPQSGMANALVTDPTGTYVYVTGNVSRFPGDHPHIGTAALPG